MKIAIDHTATDICHNIRTLFYISIFYVIEYDINMKVLNISYVPSNLPENRLLIA